MLLENKYVSHLPFDDVKLSQGLQYIDQNILAGNVLNKPPLLVS